MKVLILTDSLSLPRADKNETVFYEQTYPYLIKKKFPEITFLTIGIGGATISDIIRQIDYYKVFEPTIFIMHCGIVDCAPRVFKKWESSLLKKLKFDFLFNPFTSTIRKYRKLKYTSAKLFDIKCRLILKTFSNSNTLLYAIDILPAHKNYEILLPGVSKSIKLYNSILNKHFNIISVQDFDLSKDVLTDYHHLNSSGHNKLFEKIELIIEKKVCD